MKDVKKFLALAAFTALASPDAVAGQDVKTPDTVALRRAFAQVMATRQAVRVALADTVVEATRPRFAQNGGVEIGLGRPVPLAEIQRLEAFSMQGDPLWNGVLIGAGAGILVLIPLGGGLAGVGPLIAAGSLLGGFVGFGIDGAIGRERIWVQIWP